MRVREGTTLVTYGNAPNEAQLCAPRELPHTLRTESIDPQTLWLRDFRLDFRFR